MKPSQQTNSLFMLLGFGLLASFLTLFMTASGVGISPDSVQYVAAARNLVFGQGLSVSYTPESHVPLTHFPPLFPLLLAAASFMAEDVLAAGRYLQAILFAGNIFLLGLLSLRLHQSVLLTVLTLALAVFSLDLLHIHAILWSEPLFIFLLLAGLIFLDDFLERGSWKFGVAAAMVWGFAALTRYAGFFLPLIGGLGVLLLSRSPKRRHYSLLFTFLSSLPIFLWFGRNVYLSHEVVDRSWVYHSLTAFHFNSLAETLATWLGTWRLNPLLKKPLNAFLLLLWLTILGVGFFTKDSKVSRSRPPTLVFLLLLVSIGYLVQIAVSLLFMDANTPLNHRILSPLFILFLLLVIQAMNKYSLGERLKRDLALFVGVLYLSLYGIRAWGFIQERHTSGYSYSQPIWRNAAVLVALAQVDASQPVYSNAADLIYLYTGRATHALPSQFNPTTRQIEENFASKMHEMLRDLQEKHGVVVLFDRVTWRNYLPSNEALNQMLPLKLVEQTADGKIYELDTITKTSR